MNILKVLIVDDEPLAHEIIIDYLADLPFVEVVAQCYLATEALNYMSENHVDLLFLDVNMPKLSGIELLKVLINKPQVIITSAYQEYALESFELDVCDYLLKPYRYDRFIKAVNKAHEQIKLQEPQSQNIGAETNSEAEIKENTLFIKVDKKHIQLKLAEITFFEAYGNYVKVWLNENVYLTPRTLSSFEEQLEDNPGFIRIHKSYIIQKSHIDFIEAGVIKMNNQQLVSIGKSYKHITKTLV
jgi:DNA-binding LytR/AlgR family response regulator